MPFSSRVFVLHLFSGALILAGLAATPRSAAAEEGFYAGLNGGKNWFRGGDGGSDTAGGNHNGSLFEIDGDDGSLLGGVVGYKFSDLWRADISYTRLNNKLDWKGAFPGGADSAFTSDSRSDVVMLNGYLHAKGYAEDIFDTFDPFIGAGIGFTNNQLDDVVEADATSGALISNVNDGDKIQPAFRLGLGLDVNIAPSLTMTSSLDAYWLGGFETGAGRYQPGFQEIGAWQVDDVISVGVSVGLRYAF